MEKNNERGAGRKAHYSEKTTPVTFRVPESKEVEFKEYANKFLAKLKIKQVKGKVNTNNENVNRIHNHVNVNAKLKKLGEAVKESIIPNLPKQKTVLRKENKQPTVKNIGVEASVDISNVDFLNLRENSTKSVIENNPKIVKISEPYDVGFNVNIEKKH